MVGSKIGRFVIVGELGAGGMGVVYAAHDPELDRQVALKVLKDSAATEEDRLRMLREGQAMARITHPNVITVFEVGVQGDSVFLAQELLDDGTLGQWLEEDVHGHAAILDKFVSAGRGLAAAHAAGLVHRDFKPDNVLLGKDGRVRVSDFGLARPLTDPASLAVTVRAKEARAAVTQSSHSPMSPLTRTGAVMGTPMFMAPEQHNGERADERSDQFSFCVALYHALYGDWPFPGKTAVALADAVINGRLQKPPRGTRVPARVRKILLRGLSVNPADRYPSMDALLADLTHVPRRHGRTVAMLAGAGVLVAGAVVGGWALKERDDASVVKPAPKPVLDLDQLTNDRAVEWLAAALERGQLDDAAEKYAMAGALALQANEPPKAAIAYSADAFMLVLRGHLGEAKQKQKDVETNKDGDPAAQAYADMAGAAIAAATGELETAYNRAQKCASAFAPTIPLLAAVCDELHGDAAADLDDVGAARVAYEKGLEIANAQGSAPRAMALQLALASLEIDANNVDRAAEMAADLQKQAAERGAASPEAQAWLVLARARIAQAQTQQALEVLEHVKPASIEPFRLRLLHTIALGETRALLGETDDGVAQIDQARKEAEKQGFVGLALEARLARVNVLIAMGSPDAAAEQAKLAKDARSRGYRRIARLAEVASQR